MVSLTVCISVDLLQPHFRPCEDLDVTRAIQLQLAIKALSTTASSRALLQPEKIQTILAQAGFAEQSSKDENESETCRASSREQELEWVLVSKAAAQTYGLVLNLLLEQIIPLSRDVWYWDEVLGSYFKTGLYSLQTSPWRLWEWSNEIYDDAWRRLQSTIQRSEDQPAEIIPLYSHWGQFYGLVKDSVRKRSLTEMQTRAISPFARCRAEARTKRSHLRRFREISACGLGVLMNEGLSFDVADDGSMTSRGRSEEERDEWRLLISKSVALMETVIRNVTVLEHGTSEFEEAVFTSVETDADLRHQFSGEQELSSSSAMIAARLQHLLRVHIPTQAIESRQIVIRNGRPSRIIRYWLLVVALVFSSTTLLRVFVHRRAKIMIWIRELGATSIDFWYNWVVEPVRKVIGTIRHDEGSEIAIMSRESLQVDRASLERMVVDFARDNHESGTGVSPNDTDLSLIRAKVREGDLTPVLRAYEKDLRRPFIGTFRGDLIRALLIQIQKTKVDVEVALGGIDALLKSQELVFGFVGLTPGILVCLGVSHWLTGFMGSRKGDKAEQKGGQTVRILRNLDRILTGSTPSNNGGMLSYKEHGMILCEVHVLRQKAQRILPGEIYIEFLEEINDLVDIRTGVERQIRVVDRIRWAYGKWLI
ncbi:MAG: hypothetical protein Q9195_006319 [Heterodermia aff. obscurata]